MREALGVLEARGLVVTRKGSGRRRGGRRRRGRRHAEITTSVDCMETRLVLEVAVAAGQAGAARP